MGESFVVRVLSIGIVSAFVVNGARLAGLRALADAAIFAASLSIGWRLLGLTRSRLSSAAAARLAVLLLVLSALSGAARLGALLGLPEPDEPVPTLVKLLAGVLWVVTALRLYDVAILPTPGPPDPPGPPDARLGLLAGRAGALEQLIGNDAWLLGRAEALRELREIRAELERLQ